MVSTLPRRDLLLAASSLLAACGGGSSEPPPPPPPPAAPPLEVHIEGLSGRIVRRLRESRRGQLAVTDAGLFRREGGNWLSLGLAEQHLHDVVERQDGGLLASSQGKGFFISRDEGASWQTQASDFGRGSGETAWVLRADGSRLLACGNAALAESLDGGQSWRLLAGNWDGVATLSDALSLAGNGDIWWGGQNGIEELVLYRRRAADGSLQQWSRLLRSPSTVKSLRLPPAEPGRVLLCGEGGIVQTRDDGASWQPVFVNNNYRFYFDVLQDPLRPQRWVSAGWSKSSDPQALRVAVSDDNAVSWREYEHPDPALHGGVWSMAVAVEAGMSVWRFGLYRGGIARLRLNL